MNFFYSYYNGEVPCWCDKCLEEMREGEGEKI